MEILKKIDGLFITPVSDGADLQNRILCDELPFKVIRYPSGKEFNGWVVPKKWEVLKAEIKKNNRLIYDGTKHPLGVMGYSESFQGKVPLEDLKKHLYFFKDAPDNIIYHCDLYYKPHLKLWGFSVPYNFFKNLKGGIYEINLQTKHSRGEMKVLEYEHKGKSREAIILNAHNCHAAQLNDGPAGYVAFIEAMKRLKGRKTRYTYRLVIAPEHLGTVFYLAGLDEKTIKNFKLGIFMEMIGHSNPGFSLQESFTGKSLIDKIAHHVLKFYAKRYWNAPFRSFLGNDECVWEAPGYEVPMISLSRCESRDLLYPQYHLDSDNLKIMREDKLEETVKIILQIIDVLEKNCMLKRKFSGLIALSNPKYNLYISPGDPAIRDMENMPDRFKWNDLMNHAFRYFDKNISILDIAIKHSLPFGIVYDYFVKFKEKGLIDFVYDDQFKN